MVFLNEGVKIFYKIVFSLSLMFKEQLMAINDHSVITRILAQESVDRTPEEQSALFELAYELKIKKNLSTFSLVKVSEEKETFVARTNYRPRLKLKSNIIRYSDFEYIWMWLPNIYKMQNPILICSSHEHGFSFQNAFQRCTPYKGYQMLLIIESESAVFGAFCDDVLDLNSYNQHVGTCDTFVFQIKPNAQPYFTNKAEEHGGKHLYLTPQYLTIGEEQPAITIDDKFMGHTFACSTYNSPPLNNDSDSKFCCLNYEIYILNFV